MNEIYVVWEMIPEEIRIYHLVQLSDEDVAKVRACHGYFFNDTGTPDEVMGHLEWLNEHLEEHKDSVVYEDEVTPGQPLLVSGELVVCGWIL